MANDIKSAGECLKAVELMLRLKLNQPEEITRAVMLEDYWENNKLDKNKFDEFIKRRDEADDALKIAFSYIFPTWDDVKKDTEWYRLYNIYQVIRYAIHEAEHPQTTGLDSYPPTQFTADEPLPGCSWTRK